MKTTFGAAAFWLAVLLVPRASRAGDATVPCPAVASRATVVGCALSRSVELQAQRASEEAALGRRQSAATILPSHPVLSGGIASRSSPTAQQLNWNVGLAQELEVTGQRGLRIDAADADVRAQRHRVAVAEANVAAEAWDAFFSYLVERDRLALAAQLSTTTEAVAATAKAMAAAGAAPEVDADVAEAAAIRAVQTRLTAELTLARAAARLQGLLGVDRAAGELEPLPAPSDAGADTPELLAAREAEANARSRIDVLRRARLPNPTVGLFAQSDGFDERVFGVTLSVPLTLPSPLGPSGAGEIAEARALASASAAEVARAWRSQTQDRSIAILDHEARRQTRALYTAERMARARARLDQLAQQVRAARLPIRDALVAQQALMDQLNGEIDARHALCLASVRLRRALGLSLALSLDGDDR